MTLVLTSIIFCQYRIGTWVYKILKSLMDVNTHRKHSFHKSVRRIGSEHSACECLDQFVRNLNICTANALKPRASLWFERATNAFNADVILSMKLFYFIPFHLNFDTGHSQTRSQFSISPVYHPCLDRPQYSMCVSAVYTGAMPHCGGRAAIAPAL